MSDRWIALHCGEESEALMERHPNAFLLLAQIAMRAKWKDCPITRLKAGEAFIGDWRLAGLKTQKSYRHAKKVLSDCRLAAFRGASTGTIATLLNTDVFSVSRTAEGEPRGERGANEGRTRGERGATNHTDTLIHGHTDTEEEGDSARKGSEKKLSKKPKAEPKQNPPPPFPSPEFLAAWSAWESHRAEIKKKLTPTSVGRQFSTFLKWGEKRTIEAIHYSIEKGWTGVYEPKDDQPSLFPQNGKGTAESRQSEAIKKEPGIIIPNLMEQ